MNIGGAFKDYPVIQDDGRELPVNLDVPEDES